jgi:energy-coupling factor transport system substrate-specific component
MSWQAWILVILALVLVGGFAWFERSRPPARIVAAVAALAALGVAGRLVFAPIPNVVATTDVALLAGYTLGAGPGFAVGALSGLVSNFWLGQGPWTPWQMAGWGLVGIAGAMLAAGGGRRMGRWGLAVAGALAGFGFGALLDLSVMVSYGGEQSFDRYLALSARGIPFNVAHAAGNAALMLAAGPALVRMLDRYRGRFEVRWSPVPLGRGAAGLAIAALLLPSLLAPRPAEAGDGLSGARGWLVRAQNADGGFGVSADDDSSVGMTGWAMLGIEAAGRNPADIESGGHSPVSYMRSNASAVTSTADLERSILALEGAGVDSRDFAGRDLVSELRKRQSDDGSFEHQVNLTAFSILAQRSARVPGSNYGKAAAWLRRAQNHNGGWGSIENGESEPDSTGAVLQALAVAPGGSGEKAAGARWLEHSQQRDGGWSLTHGAPTNSQSVAWAIQGLVATGRDPAAIRHDGRSGLDYLAARQSGDGHYMYSSSADQTPVWVTAQGLTAVARQPFPIAAVKRRPSRGGSKGDGGHGGGNGGAGDAPRGGGGPRLGETGGSVFGPGPGSGHHGGPARGFSSRPGRPSRGRKRERGGPRPGVARALSTDPEDRIAGISATGEPAAAIDPPAEDSAPSTPVLLGALGALCVGLGLGFLWYRRRLP